MIFHSPHPLVEIPETSLTDFVLRHVSRLSDKPAFVDGASGRTISYGQAAEQIGKVAGALADRGFSTGDVLAIYAPNLIEYPILIHAAVTAGGAVTTVNPVSSVEDLNKQLMATSASMLVTTTAMLPRARAAAENTAVKELILLDEAPHELTYKHLLELNKPPRSAEINPKNDVAVLPFSSGTTGLPKGVMLTHHNMVANAAQFASLSITTEQDVVLSIPPLFHIYGITVVVNVIMANGSTVVTMPQFDLETMLTLLQKYRITQAFLVPPVVQLLAKHPLVEKFDLTSLKSIVCGGAPLSADLSDACSQRLNCNVLQVYGMTEAGPVTHIGHRDSAKNSAGTIGPVIPNTSYRIVSVSTGEQLGPEQEGEIWVKGPQIMKGYLNNTVETEKILTADGWLKTGDVGKADKDGHLVVLDRIKELIKVKGFQVAPAELEGILLKHPAVAEAAVVPSPDQECGEVPVAYIVKKGSVTADQLMEFVAEQVTSYKRIRLVEFVDSIPKTSSGKILRRELIQEQRQKVAERQSSGCRLHDRVTVEKKGNVLLVALDRPNRSNAFDSQMFAGLAQALTQLDDDSELRCAVVFANGSDFTAGLDLASMLPVISQGGELVPSDLVDPWGVNGGRQRRKPLIVAVQGRCLSVGVELCLAADIVVASEGARFALPEVSLGLMPLAGATFRMPARAGWADAMRYLLTGEEFGAQEALRLGIVQQLAAPDDVRTLALSTAEKIAAQAPLAVQAVLASARLALDSSRERAAQSLLPLTRELAATADCKEGLRSFFDKRTASFKGT
jgi:acyl-CoA synthetase (AMP-forming)/AMP-acid ligase II/enoyl-CoA hydratase/carnithine racemase